MEVMPASSHPEVKEVPSHEGKYESKEKLKFTDTIWVSMNSIERLMQSSLIESSALSEFFDQASAISVPKSRYLPVEATSDLPLYESDLYSFDEGIPNKSC
ncbi:UTP--glucose-1-phosphate uridylyltransferase-like isoform X3 [Coffea arabica]